MRPEKRVGDPFLPPFPALLLIVLPLLVLGCGTDDGARRAAVVSARELPVPGVEIPVLPPGEGLELAQSNCLACHSSEMFQQQQLTGNQWAAEVDKMQRWGAGVQDEDKAALVAYLVSHFGPDNDRFKPIVVRPASSAP